MRRKYLVEGVTAFEFTDTKPSLTGMYLLCEVLGKDVKCYNESVLLIIKKSIKHLFRRGVRRLVGQNRFLVGIICFFNQNLGKCFSISLC